MAWRAGVAWIVGASLWIGAAGCGVGESIGAPMPADQLAQRIASGAPLVVLDVRTREEFERGRIPGAIHIPYDELPDRLAELQVARSDEVVVYCQSGRRAEIAKGVLREQGFSNVRSLTGHWREWRAAGRPTE